MILDAYGLPIRKTNTFIVPKWIVQETMAKLKQDAEDLRVLNLRWSIAEDWTLAKKG